MVIRMQQGQADTHRGKKSENSDPIVHHKNRRKELVALSMYYSNLGETALAEKYRQEMELLERQGVLGD